MSHARRGIPGGPQTLCPKGRAPARKPLPVRGSRFVLSSGGRTRTCDPTVNSRLLYQLSYAGMKLLEKEKKKLSNPRGGVNGTQVLGFRSLAFSLMGFRHLEPGRRHQAPAPDFG